MELNFTKMHGCGNDFVFVNMFDGASEADAVGELAARLCDRNYGIGADGLILVLPSKTEDAYMRMYNPDGTEAGMCGNAIRCMGKYLWENGHVQKTRMSIGTLGGVKVIDVIIENGLVAAAKVNMGAPRFAPAEIPTTLPATDQGERIINTSLIVDGREYAVTCVNMGNPHAVVFCDDVIRLPLQQIGPLFEHASVFPERINTEFIQIIERNHLLMRVWERGAGETLACGTGASAAAVAAVLNGHCDSGTDIRIRLSGGELIINYSGDVFMTGGCEKVFEGRMQL